MTSFQRLAINLSSILVGLSGAVYAWMKYLMTADDPYAAVNHPLQPWMLDLHVLASPAMIFALGLILQEHILAQYRRGARRTGGSTGLMAMICLLPMIATGYLIQVFVDETARRVCVGVHLVTGLIYLAAFLAHLLLARRRAVGRRAASMGEASA